MQYTKERNKGGEKKKNKKKLTNFTGKHKGFVFLEEFSTTKAQALTSGWIA